MAAQSKVVIEEEIVRTMRLVADVTRACIDEGALCLPSRCMLNLAVNIALRKLPGQKHKNHYVRVQNGNAFWSYEGRRYRAVLPANAVRAYLAFDRGEGGSLRPFIVTLKGQEVGPVTKHSRARMDRINELRRAKGAPSHGKKYTLRERIAGTIEPIGRPPKAA